MISNELFSAFGLDSTNLEMSELNAGHINDTFLIKDKTSGKGYIFQKINTYVFKEPEKVMFNIEKVSEHLKGKLDNESDVEDYRQMLFFRNTINGKNYYIDSKNQFWRVYTYVDRAFTYDYPETLEILCLMGKRFGLFQNQLADFDASVLYETIPNFHNTKARIERFKQVMAEDKFDRVKDAPQEIEYLIEASSLASKLSEMIEAGKIQLRVTHNDTKCNNVLFDKETKRPIAVIDLDTIMPGLAAYDFGDAIRSAASTAAEDEADTTKVHIDLDRYESFAKGFVSEVASNLTETEIDSLALGAFTMTYEVGLRFLTDYFEGDVYFKTKYG
ncbi:MAG: aminoglycoside phosphotransferase family protein, partial [Clostridia bacterium]|nr:aminoglycoside phosphotransferase family protein [Clostridia bacterium]